MNLPWQDLIFGAAALAGIGASVMMVTRKNPVYSAVWLLAAFLSFAVVFLTLNAPFLAAIHVIVYTGAILVLFLFVIMLLNLRGEELGKEIPIWAKGLIAVAALALLGGLGFVLYQSEVLPGDLAKSPPELTVKGVEKPVEFGGVHSVGDMLFGRFVMHFELIALLLLVAMIGAMILAKKKP